MPTFDELWTEVDQEETKPPAKSFDALWDETAQEDLDAEVRKGGLRIAAPAPPTQMDTVVGGPPRPVASFGETMADIPGPFEPISGPLPRMKPVGAGEGQFPPTPVELAINQIIPGGNILPPEMGVQLNRTIANQAIGMADFMRSPGGATIAATAPVAPTLVALGFTADMAKSLYEQGKQAYADWDRMSGTQKLDAVLNIAATAGMTALAGKHGYQGVRNKIVPPVAPLIPVPPKPPVPGSAIVSPAGASVPRIEPPTGIERTTPAQRIALEEQMQREATTGVTAPPVPKPPRPTVPEGELEVPTIETAPPETPRQEIATWDDAVAALKSRGTGNETRAEIQALFPEVQLTREAAGDLAKSAWADQWQPGGKPRQQPQPPEERPADDTQSEGRLPSGEPLRQEPGPVQDQGGSPTATPPSGVLQAPQEVAAEAAAPAAPKAPKVSQEMTPEEKAKVQRHVQGNALRGRPVIEINGPDGHKYRATYDGMFDIPGKPIHSVTLLEYLPGFKGPLDSVSNISLSKVGYTLPEKLPQVTGKPIEVHPDYKAEDPAAPAAEVPPTPAATPVPEAPTKPAEPPKPEGKPRHLMSPEEFEASQHLKGKAAQHRHAMEFVNARTAKQPLNAAAVDKYGIKLQQGYVKEGDLYVFKEPSPQQKIQINDVRATIRQIEERIQRNGPSPLLKQRLERLKARLETLQSPQPVTEAGPVKADTGNPYLADIEASFEGDLIGRIESSGQTIIGSTKSGVGKDFASRLRELRQMSPLKKILEGGTDNTKGISLDEAANDFGFETTDAFLDALEGAAKFRESGRERARLQWAREKVDLEFQQAAQHNSGVSAKDKGTKTRNTNDLKPEDQIKIKGEWFEVLTVDAEGTVTLRDGPKFGRQELPPDIEVWVKAEKIAKLAEVEDVWGVEPEPAAAPPTPEPPKPAAAEAPKAPSGELLPAEDIPFNLTGETVKAPEVKPAESSTGFGNETLFQQEMFAIQKVVEGKDPVKSADAAQELYGSPGEAANKIEAQLKRQDSDPAVKKAFTKEQRERLKAVLALLRQRAIPISMGGAVPSEYTPGQQMTSSMKNAAVDADRKARGQPEMMAALRKTDPEVWAQAMNVLDNDWYAPDKLLASLKANPRVLLDWENMLLLHRRVDLKNEWVKLDNEYKLAQSEGRTDMAEASKQSRDLMMEKLQELEALTGRGPTAAGTLAGRALRARQTVMNEDYSLAELVREREARTGEKVADDSPEMTKLRKIAADWKETSDKLTANLAEKEKELQATELKRIAAQAEADAKGAASPYVIKIAEKLVGQWDNLADGARQRIKDRGIRFSTGLDPTVLLDVAEIGLSHIGHIGLDFARWSARMVQEFGDGIKPHLQQVWLKAQDMAERSTIKVAGKKQAPVVKGIILKTPAAPTPSAPGVTPGTKAPKAAKPVLNPKQKIAAIRTRLAKPVTGKQKPPNLAYAARQLAKEFWEDGVRDPDLLLNAVWDALKESEPDLTRREAMDILSGYGSYRLLPKDEMSNALRDMNGQWQQIAKLEDMAAGEAPLRSGGERRIPSDAERAKIKQVEEAKRRGGYTVTDPERQLRTALDAVQRRFENQIKDLELEIAQRQKIVRNRTKLEYDDKTRALQARRDELKAIHDEVFKKPALTDAERLARWKENVRSRIEAYEERIALGDFAPRKRPELPRLDREALDLRYKLNQVHRALLDMRLKDDLSKRSKAKKLVDGIGNTIRFSRAVMTGGEFSAVLRQGGLIALSRPITAAKSLAPMFKALMSEKEQFRVNEDIHAGRANSLLYDRAGLEFTESGMRLSNMEEHYMFRVSERAMKVPVFGKGVKALEAFQRAYTTFLNNLRADVFDKMTETYGSDPATAKAIANYINVATGRGSTGLGKWVGPGLNAVFFAPRYSISRFQYLTGQPVFAATTMKGRTMILKEYGRALAGAAVVYSLGQMMGGEVEADPRSADFGKVKFGNTRVDPMSGLLQATRLLATSVTGWRKDRRGKLVPIRDTGKILPESSKRVPFGQPDMIDVTADFTRNKLSPAVGSAISAAAAKFPGGKKFTLGDVLIQSTTPITYNDVLKAMQEQGIPKGTALGVLAVFGMGLQTYDANAKRD